MSLSLCLNLSLSLRAFKRVNWPSKNIGQSGLNWKSAVTFFKHSFVMPFTSASNFFYDPPFFILHPSPQYILLLTQPTPHNYFFGPLLKEFLFEPPKKKRKKERRENNWTSPKKLLLDPLQKKKRLLDPTKINRKNLPHDKKYFGPLQKKFSSPKKNILDPSHKKKCFGTPHFFLIAKKTL